MYEMGQKSRRKYTISTGMESYCRYARATSWHISHTTAGRFEITRRSILQHLMPYETAKPITLKHISHSQIWHVIIPLSYRPL